MRTNPAIPRTRRRAFKAATVCALAAIVLAPTPVIAAPAAAPAAAPVAATVSAPATEKTRFALQKLAWRACFADIEPGELPPGWERLECATMQAPLNWARASARDSIEIAVTRLRPATGTPRGTLFMNPGGPGAPGQSMPLVLLQRAAVAQAYELVGFDVRGTGESTNVTCGDMTTSTNDPRNRSRANLDLIWDTNEVFVRHCALRSGELLRYITTEQTVRDLDLLRHLLGWQKISWVGYSGGTWMGAYYATFFPQRVDRFVFDSNTEFTTTWQNSFLWQPLGFERRFRQDFTPWAARYNERFGLGTTPEAVRQFYERLRADLNREPVDGLFNTIDGAYLDLIIVGALYSKFDFQNLAETMQFLRATIDEPAGAATASVPASVQAVLAAARRKQPGQRPVAAADAYPATFNAITCQDTPWNRSHAFWERESARQGQRYPLIGWSFVINPCVDWPRPNIQLPRPTGRGVPPVQMVQSVRDPATPYEGAVRAHRAFAGSRMLTVTNEGDHGIYTVGNECVDTLVDAFLLTGALPATDRECAGTGLPEPVDPPQEGERRRQSTPQSPLQLNERYADLLARAVR